MGIASLPVVYGADHPPGDFAARGSPQAVAPLSADGRGGGRGIGGLHVLGGVLRCRVVGGSGGDRHAAWRIPAPSAGQPPDPAGHGSVWVPGSGAGLGQLGPRAPYPDLRATGLHRITRAGTSHRHAAAVQFLPVSAAGRVAQSAAVPSSGRSGTCVVAGGDAQGRAHRDRHGHIRRDGAGGDLQRLRCLLCCGGAPGKHDLVAGERAGGDDR